MRMTVKEGKSKSDRWLSISGIEGSTQRNGKGKWGI